MGMSSDSSLPSSAALKIVDLKKTYKDKKNVAVEALKGVSLTIEQGEFFAFLGPNGAGKTTLISIVAGLAHKTAGTVEVSGISIDENHNLAKSYVGIVPQEFNFNWFETVFDIVVNQAGYYGIPRKDVIGRAETLLKDLGIWDKKDVQAMKLSGGMKRRLMIARALIHEPKVLLLDEPTAGVDVELRRSMWDFLRELNNKGTTIILTTHYLEEAEQLASRVGIINGGVIIADGTVKELLTKLNYVTLIMDTVEGVTDAQLQLIRELKTNRLDESTFELTLSPGDTVNDAIRRMTKVGIQIANIRNNGSRLEEVFVNLVEKKK